MHEGKYLAKVARSLFFTKRNLIILFLIIIAYILYSYMNLNLGFNQSYFHFIYIDYINIYIQSCISLAVIINSIFVSLLVVNDLKIENRMLILMIEREIGPHKYEQRRGLIIISIINMLISAQYLIMLGLVFIFYPKFSININFILVFLYLWLITTISYLLSYILMGLFKSVYIICIPSITIIIVMLADNAWSKYLIMSFNYEKSFNEYIGLFLVLISILIMEIALSRLLETNYYK